MAEWEKFTLDEWARRLHAGRRGVDELQPDTGTQQPSPPSP